MAIQLNTQPNGTLNLVGNQLCFEFTVTGVETGTTVRRFGYQLFDSNNNPLTAIEAKTPKEGVKFPIDFRKDVIDKIWTEPPSCATIGRNEPEMEIKIKLKYWEYVYDKEKCTTVIEGEVTTSEYVVLNSTDQWFGYLNTGTQNFLDLTYKPSKVVICKDQCDVNYFWSQGTTTITMRAYDSSGAFLGSEGTSGTGPISARVSPRDIATLISNPPIFVGTPPTYEEALSRIHRIDVLVNGVVQRSYYLGSCCCVTTVWYQSYRGGYSTLGFDCIDGLLAAGSYSEVCRYQPKEVSNQPFSSNIRERNGLSIHNKKSFRTYELSKLLTRDEADNLIQYEDFLDSGSYYLEFNALLGQLNDTITQKVKFMPTAGSVRYYKKDDIHRLVITGKVNQQHRLPNYAI